MLDIRFITTLGMAIFHSACGLVEYCIPRVVINLDIQHSSVQYLLIIVVYVCHFQNMSICICK